LFRNASLKPTGRFRRSSARPCCGYQSIDKVWGSAILKPL
jgi:hypothetical protein